MRLRCQVLIAVVMGLVALLVKVNHDADGAVRKIWPQPLFSVSDIPSQKGRVALITGANVGLGKETAIQLAKKGAKVVLACRSSCQPVVDEIKRMRGGDATAMSLDLGDSKSIFEFAREYRKLGLPIHMLILNAGIMMVPTFTTTKDGLESQLGVNWVGHFYLQQLLQDIVEKSAPSRVVILSSKAHEIFVQKAPPPGLTIRDNAESRAAYSPYGNYGISKLCNILHAQELHERMKEAGKEVEVISVHPGSVDTDLGRHIMDFLRPYVGDSVVQFTKRISDLMVLDVHSGSLTQLWAATSPDVTANKLSGSYAVPIARVIPPSKIAQDKQLQKRVWEEGMEIIKNFPRQ